MSAQPLFLNPSCVCLFMNHTFCLCTLDCGDGAGSKPEPLHKGVRAHVSEAPAANYGGNLHAGYL